MVYRRDLPPAAATAVTPVPRWASRNASAGAARPRPRQGSEVRKNKSVLETSLDLGDGSLKTLSQHPIVTREAYIYCYS